MSNLEINKIIVSLNLSEEALSDEYYMQEYVIPDIKENLRYLEIEDNEENLRYLEIEMLEDKLTGRKRM